MMKENKSSQKPKSITQATNMLWATIAIGLIKITIDFTYLNNLAPAAFTNFVLISTFAFIGFLILKISAGKNWARITFLVFFILGTLPSLPIVLGEFSRSSVIGAISVAQIGIQLYSLFLLFTQPGSDWFRKDLSA